MRVRLLKKWRTDGQIEFYVTLRRKNVSLYLPAVILRHFVNHLSFLCPVFRGMQWKMPLGVEYESLKMCWL